MALTDEDKQWLDARFSVEREWADRRSAIDKEEFRAELDSKIERVETRLLTEFHKWASPINRPA